MRRTPDAGGQVAVVDDRQRADAFLRRQLELTAAAAAVVLAALGLAWWGVQAQGRRGHHVIGPSGVRYVNAPAAWWPWAVTFGVLVFALLILVLLVHAVRVAAFAFRREVS